MRPETPFALLREMAEASSLAADFDVRPLLRLADRHRGLPRVVIVGEGSSRLFPGQRMVYEAAVRGLPLEVRSLGGCEALETDLRDSLVIAVSNSGRTRETLRVVDDVQSQGIATVAMTTDPASPLAQRIEGTYLIPCGREHAVAATKSVIAQALAVRALVLGLAGLDPSDGTSVAPPIAKALATEISSDVAESLARARTIYIAGRTDGVAEELVLKTIEIPRKRAVFVAGTQALHGLEEVVEDDDALVLVEPFAAEADRFDAIYRRGLGVPTIAVASGPTPFTTVVVPRTGPHLQAFTLLAGGWRALVAAGEVLGLDLDRPRRARKVGNPG